MSPTAVALTKERREELVQAALKARDASHSPYSKFRVGAALLTETGELITGCNVENASIGATICAERTALVKAVSEGHRKFLAIAVSSDLKEACSPCGICRQFIREFSPLSLPVLLVPAHYDPRKESAAEGQTEKTEEDGKAGKIVELTLGELLPFSFGPEDLQK